MFSRLISYLPGCDWFPGFHFSTLLKKDFFFLFLQLSKLCYYSMVMQLSCCRNSNLEDVNWFPVLTMQSTATLVALWGCRPAVVLLWVKRSHAHNNNAETAGAAGSTPVESDTLHFLRERNANMKSFSMLWKAGNIYFVLQYVKSWRASSVLKVWTNVP